jgi:hypothetical protein
MQVEHKAGILQIILNKIVIRAIIDHSANVSKAVLSLTELPCFITKIHNIPKKKDGVLRNVLVTA